MFMKLQRKWRRSIAKRARKFFPTLVRKTTHDQDQWQQVAQPGEFDFHKKNQWRQTDAFLQDSAALFEHFDLNKEDYKNATVIDLGAGSKLRTKYFDQANIIAIEPLADQFIEEIPWTDLKTAQAIYSTPAEEKIEECDSVADLLVSINVLDHCYNFEQIVGNVRSYLKPDGLAFLTFDAHDTTDEMHPLVLNHKVCLKIFNEQGLEVEKHSQGFGDSADRLANGDHTYGHGEYCLNYWLRKAA